MNLPSLQFPLSRLNKDENDWVCVGAHLCVKVHVEVCVGVRATGKGIIKHLTRGRSQVNEGSSSGPSRHRSSFLSGPG